VLEGWRPGYIQRRMWLTTWMRFQNLHPEWSDVQRKRVVNRYTAPPDGPAPAPHSTGGAIDVMLVDLLGKRLDTRARSRRSTRALTPPPAGLSPEAERNRQVLREPCWARG